MLFRSVTVIDGGVGVVARVAAQAAVREDTVVVATRAAGADVEDGKMSSR